MTDEIYRKTFAKNFNHYMEINGKTQTDIVNDLGFNRSAVSTWANGTRLPRMDKVDALAKYFRINRSDLIEDKSNQERPEYYLNKETAEMAQALFENRELRMLFSAAQDASPDDLKTTYDVLMALKRKESGKDDY